MAVKEQEQTEINIGFPGQYSVVLHNDNYTTFEFVIELLIELFGKNEHEAILVTQAVHEKGKGIAGTYGREIAEMKSVEGMMAAQQFGFPLLLTVEKI